MAHTGSAWGLGVKCGRVVLGMYVERVAVPLPSSTDGSQLLLTEMSAEPPRECTGFGRALGQLDPLRMLPSCALLPSAS